MGAVLVVLGAVIGSAISLVAALWTEHRRQRGRRDEQHDEHYRRVSGDFVGLSIAARYEYEILAHNRRHDHAVPIPMSLREVDADVARAYNQLSLIASTEAFDRATRLRRCLEDTLAWVVEAGPEELTVDAVDKRAGQIWMLRNRFVECVRSELGHTDSLKWEEAPGS